MSTYELDDALVRRLVNTTYAPDKMDAASAVAASLASQMPDPEPDRKYLVEDKDGDVWKWNPAQQGWSCITQESPPVRWHSIISNHGPVTIYGPCS